MSSHVRKWVGLPRCLTSIGLYGNGALSLPISRLMEECKCAKVRWDTLLKESRDTVVRYASPNLVTGRKWNPARAVQDAKSAIRHRDIVGQVHKGREGFGLETPKPTWQKATPAERRQLVVEEVRHQEKATRTAKAVSQAKQGPWKRYEGIENRNNPGKTCGIKANRISFLIWATYGVPVPSPTNLNLWLGEDAACPLYSFPANLKHILVDLKSE